MTDIDNWLIFIIVYLILAAVTFLPVVRNIFRRTESEKWELYVKRAKGNREARENERLRYRQKINPFAGPEFTSDRIRYMGFSEEQWLRLYLHYDRIIDTLDRWRRTVTWSKGFHYYVVCWTLMISIVIPVMVAFIDISEYYAKVFLMVISLHSAVMLAFHRALKIENNYKAFRQGEAEFHDLCRRFLDMPQTFGKEDSDAEEQICNYFTQAEQIRKFVRAAETDNFPAVDDKSGAAARGRTLGANDELPGTYGTRSAPPENAPPNIWRRAQDGPEDEEDTAADDEKRE